MKLKMVRKICLGIVLGVFSIAGMSFTSNCTLHAQAAEDAKVHYLVLPGNTEGILLECNGRFGMVDSGEDSDYPTGEDERYPYRSGTTIGHGTEEQVISYMRSVGVTDDNFEFYIGTHAHSDHIGSADEIIREFRPQRVYIQEYQDAYIRNEGRLWDNLYCYDHMIEAAEEVGAEIIQEFGDGADQFFLGSEMSLRICNYGDFYKQEGSVNDANDFSLGVLVEASGKRVFLSGDINNSKDGEYAEFRLLEDLGSVDILTLGHHGGAGSNSYAYVSGLSPKTMILSGDFGYVSRVLDEDGYAFDETLRLMSDSQVPLFATGWFAGELDAVVFTLGEQITSNIPEETRKIAYTNNITTGGMAVCYHNGLQEMYDGWLSSNGCIAYFERSAYGSKSQRWMKDESGNYRYLDGTGVCRVGWLQINGKYYYFDSDAIMQTGWQVIEGKKYYFNPWGALISGWKKDEEGNWLYYTDTGNMAVGWLKAGGRWYYMDETGYMQTGWQIIGDKEYYFNSSGALATGWKKDEAGNWLYYTAAGSAATGWLKLGGRWYYMDEAGYMQTGWQIIGDKKYYFHSSGALATGWQKDGDGNWFYYTGAGSAATGWLKLGGRWYYMDEAGYMQTGWQIIGDKKYYFHSSGVLATGWQKDGDGNWFYYTGAGNAATGWLKVGRYWYYMNEMGAMLTGKQQIGISSYYLDDNGRMVTGWNMEEAHWYYYGANGAMLTDRWISGKYYLKSDGTMAVSEWVDSGKYYVDQNGRWVPGKQPDAPEEIEGHEEIPAEDQKVSTESGETDAGSVETNVRNEGVSVE